MNDWDAMVGKSTGSPQNRMTPDELEKEAERIREYTISHLIGDEKFGQFVLDILRAVHNVAIEKAAAKHDGCKCPNFIAEDIRTLKLSGGRE